MFLSTDDLSSQFTSIFMDFCAEKKVSDKNIIQVFEQAVGKLANEFGLDIKVEKKRPAGIEASLCT